MSISKSDLDLILRVKEVLTEGCLPQQKKISRVDVIPEIYFFAQDILGANFISPHAIEDTQGVKYTEKALQHMLKTFPSKERLGEIRDQEYALVAGVHSVGTLARYIGDVRLNVSQCCDWIILSRKALPSSSNKLPYDQYGLLSDDQRVPTAAEVAWVTAVYQRIYKRGKFFSDKIYVRTSSFSPDEEYLVVGEGHNGKISICICENNARPHIGLAYALKNEALC